MLVFTSKLLFTPTQLIEDAAVIVEGGSVVSLVPRSSMEVTEKVELKDLGEGTIAPGLVDIHIHGAVGHDVMDNDAHGHAGMEKFLAQHGITSYFPTTVTAGADKILAALERLASRIESAKRDGAGRAQPLGIHLEGPFLSHRRRGVHPAENLLPPSVRAFERFWQASRGNIRVMTIAPELDGAEELITEATRRGVCVSLGHSDADIANARKGVTAGARHATHTFNAMRPLDHREPGIIGEVLTDKRLTADVIADGVHVDPTVVALLLRAKGPEGTVLITDGTSATGMPEGRYKMGAFEVDVKGGRVTHDGTLAGSVLTLDRAVQNAMKFAQWSLQDSVRAASLNPAKTVCARNKGFIGPGADADFVVLTPQGEVMATVVGGALVQ